MNSYLRVQSGNQFFAVPVADVDRVYVPENITSIPGAPVCIRGAISIAGSIYVVADMRHLACGLLANVDVKSRIVCLVNPVAGAMFSILVDRVLEIVSIGDEQLQSSERDSTYSWYRRVNSIDTPLFVTSAAEIYAATNASCIG